MPARRYAKPATILRWVNDKPEFREQYRESCKFWAEGIIDEMIDIADDASQDWKQVGNRRVLDKAVIRRDRIRLETRKWALSRMQLKKHHP